MARERLKSLEELGKKLDSWGDKDWSEFRDYMLENADDCNHLVEQWKRQVRTKDKDKDSTFDEDWSNRVIEILNDFLEEKLGANQEKSE